MTMTETKTYKKDKYKDKDKDKVLTRPNVYYIYSISRGFKDLEYYIGCLLVMT